MSGLYELRARDGEQAHAHYALGPGVNLADRMMFCRLGTQDLCLPTHAATLPSRILHPLAE